MGKQISVVKALITLALMVSVAGCSTMVTIQSDPPGADIILNNQKIGKTPFAVKLSDFAFNSYDVLLKKDGYVDFHGRVAKEAKAGAIVGGFFLWGIPWLWCYGPQPYQTFYMAENGKSVGASVVNKAENVSILIDGKEIGNDPVTIVAGTHEIAFMKTDGTTILKQAEFQEGNWYEFHL